MSDLTNAILNGEFDNELNDIVGAVNSRRDIVSRIKTASIPVGATVRFNSHIRPKYLEGLTVEVKKVNRKTVVADFPTDTEYGKFSGAFNVKVPTSTVDVENG